MKRWWMDFRGSFTTLFGAFEGAYSLYSSRMQRRRGLTTPERRRQSIQYTLLAEEPSSCCPVTRSNGTLPDPVASRPAPGFLIRVQRHGCPRRQQERSMFIPQE